MEKQGEDTPRPNVFLKTRSKKNAGPTEEVEAAFAEMKRRLAEVPPAEHTPEFVDSVFIEIMGPDGHGRVRTFGTGPTPTSINGSKSSYEVPSTNTINKIVDERVDAKIAGYERRRKEDMKNEVLHLMQALAAQHGFPVPSSDSQVVKVWIRWIHT